MSFSTAVSGLNAAANMLSVTGNNIANVNTTGFKLSRSEFADVYASSVGSGGKTTPGQGVVVANVAQTFGQGNLQSTGNSLDLAISGGGFFILGQNTSNFAKQSYTRAGAFHTDTAGYIVSNTGQPLLAYSPNGTTVAEGFSTGVLQPIQLNSTQGEPKATTTITTAVNLDARQTGVDQTAHPFVGPVSGVVDPATYNHSTSQTVYDSLGNSHIVSNYYVKSATSSNAWTVFSYLDSANQLSTVTPSTTPPTGNALAFDTSGNLTTPGNGQIQYQALTITGGAAPLTLTLNLSGTTQVGSPFSVNSLNQDGLSIGQLSSIDIDDAGVIFARFTNGLAKPLGQVGLVSFSNPQGLTKLGDTNWGESAQSGSPVKGVAGTGVLGSIKAGNLEGSNVDLSQQLVNLIVAQQAYQANAQTITTENEITRTLLQIR